MYYLLVLAVGVERLAELIVARRNARWSFAQGGKEFGRPHYVVMVTLHTALLLGCLVEPWALHRPFIPWLGWPMVGVLLLSQGCAGGASSRWDDAGTPGSSCCRTSRWCGGALPADAPPELCCGGGRRVRAADGAHRMVDRTRFHRGQRHVVDGAPAGGEPVLGYS